MDVTFSQLLGAVPSLTVLFNARGTSLVMFKYAKLKRQVNDLIGPESPFESTRQSIVREFIPEGSDSVPSTRLNEVQKRLSPLLDETATLLWTPPHLRELDDLVDPGGGPLRLSANQLDAIEFLFTHD